MNYLAHIFLSGENRRLQVGNFIGDFVKGSKHELYPKTIQRGILLHREIDAFTDAHPIFQQTEERLKPTFGRYSGILVDMFYDYILATDFHLYSTDKSLQSFSRNFYLSALLNYNWLPRPVKAFIFYFIKDNQLMRYASYEGLQASLQLMADHKSDAIKPQKSIDFLIKYEADIRSDFHLFMPDLIEFVEKKESSLLLKPQMRKS